MIDNFGMEKDRLFELYKISIDEYRFQVQYNWDRTKFYLLLTSSVVSVAASLLRIPGAKDFEFVLIPLFIIGGVIAAVGLLALQRGHEYYRRTVLKMSQLSEELKLSLEEQPIATTEGQREAKDNLKDTQTFVKRPFRIGTVNYYLAALFVLAMAANGVGLVAVVFDQYFKRIV